MKKRPRVISITEPIKEERAPPSEDDYEFVERHDEK